VGFFESVRSAGRAALTVHVYASIVHRFLRWCVEAELLQADPLAGFTVRLPKALPRVPIQDYLRAMAARGARVGTRALHQTALVQFFRWSQEKHRLPRSIAQGLGPIKRVKFLHHYWTEAQVAQFRSAFRGDPPRLTFSGYVPKGLRHPHRLAPPEVVIARDRSLCELGLQGFRVSSVVTLRLDHVIAVDDPERAAVRL
jgi:site-specific recombinase XerD